MTKPAALAGGLLLLALALAAACGGDESTVTVTFRPEIPADTAVTNTGAILDSTVGTIRRRAELYGLDIPEITVSPDNTITVTAKGVSAATATELFGRRAALEFMRPRLTEEGIVACETASGELFGVAPQNVNPDEASRSPARCFSRDKTGNVVWDPAVATEGGGQLTPAAIAANGWFPGDDTLTANFTPAGATTLEILTGELAGYPLAIFLDGELIAAPRINRAITNGQAIISGISADQARLRAAQLNSGPLAARLEPAPAPTPAP